MNDNIGHLVACNTKCKKYSRGKYKIYEKMSFTTAFGLGHVTLVYFIGVNPRGGQDPPSEGYPP